MKNFFKSVLILCLLLLSERVHSFTGDTIHIITHNKMKVITDPSKGFNHYKSLTEFPSENIKYRKAILHVTYQCPDSQRCGEWDYIDNIYLRKEDSETDSTVDIELARMISPYGSRFAPDWKFSWKVDVTDFSFLLHDSVEIVFNHTGYESNTDRGWLVTLDFELTEGTPVMEVLGFEKLWSGSFPYGDGNDDIENYLKPVTFRNIYDADIARVRILQTGHGMDDLENCAEFCNKYRKIFFDNELIEQKQIWRECGDNPLYPQAGTWIFDRANWCPGAMVYPDVYDFKIEKNSEHVIDIEMEKYVNPNKPSANYVFSSYIFYYKESSVSNDVSLEEIITPSDEDIYSRKNPVCTEPVIVIRNNGKNNLSDLKITYGIESDSLTTFDWKGNLKPNKTQEITLPGVISGKEGKNKFVVSLLYPNGYEDEYNYDNSKTSVIKMPPVYDKKIIVVFKTNNEPAHNFYQVINERGLILKQRNPGSLEANTIYRDTLRMGVGCYRFILGDTANDGLDFWFNPEGGYGYVRILDTNGRLIKSFNSDFGSGIAQQFMVTGNPASNKNDIEPILNIFPIRNPGKFFCDVFLNERQNITLEITTEDKSKVVYKKKYKKFKDGMIDIDINKQPDGFYIVNLIVKGVTISKRIKVKRD